ncbi:MAG: sulfurtransferase TusA family protein [Archaeoglobaceae archaeon]
MVVVDARGSYCPGPLMELIKTLKQVEVGEVVEVLSSDESSAKDIPEWVKKAGHELVEVKKEDDYWRIVVRKLK